MTTVTYHTRVPESLIPFCEAMADLMPHIERSLYRGLEAGRAVTDLKRAYQRRYGINARHFNALYAVLKGKIKSLIECRKRHIKHLQSSISGLEKLIRRWRKQVPRIPLACPLQQGDKTPRQLLRWRLHQKQRRLHTLKAQLERIQHEKPRLVFGGQKRWAAQFNLEANQYPDHAAWWQDWQDARNSQFYFVGSKDETAGCQVCQLTPEGNLKIRVPAALEPQFGKSVTTSGIQFPYGQPDIDWALTNQQSISYRFARKAGRWYIYATVERPEVPYQSQRHKGAIGVDLNPGSIGWAYCDAEGNLKATGQFPVNLQDRSTEQTQAQVGDVAKQLVTLAHQYGCPIVTETLDFERKKATMREQGVRYARMLSNFAYGLFDAMLSRRCVREGIELIRVNPA
ncbi:IS200/IS605 family accessory protein TnpB-related protein, partial [Thermoleptolyngbya sp.]